MTPGEERRIFNAWINAVSEQGARIRASHSVALRALEESHLKKSLSLVIGEKARDYVKKLRTGEIFSVDFSPVRGPSFTVVPATFLTIAEHKKVEFLLRVNDPKRRVVNKHELQDWAARNFGFDRLKAWLEEIV